MMKQDTGLDEAWRPGLLQRINEPLRKVVLVRPARLGDFLCATPALRALRAALPQAEISMITLPARRDLVVRLQALNRFIPFPGYPGIAEQLFDAGKTLKFFQQMQAERFDLAVQMHESGVYSNPFTRMLGARWTAGFVRSPEWAEGLNAALPIPRSGHEVDRILTLASFLGAPPKGRHTDFPLEPKDYGRAETLLAEATAPLIGVHPGAMDTTRRWDPSLMGQAGGALIRRYGGTLVLLGTQEEYEICQQAAAAAGVTCRNLAGETRLAVLGAVIARLALLVANSSGPSHIAFALGTPSVTVFRDASVERYGPPLNDLHRCVRGIEPAGQPATASLPEDEMLVQVVHDASELLVRRCTLRQARR